MLMFAYLCGGKYMSVYIFIVWDAGCAFSSNDSQLEKNGLFISSFVYKMWCIL